LLAPTTRHGAEELRVEKRHLTMEGVLVCLLRSSLHGDGRKQTWPTRPDSHELRRGAQPQTNVACGSKARRRQGRQRLVRIESPQVKSPRQIGRTRRSEAGVVKTQAPRASSEKKHRVGKSSVDSRWSERDSLENGRARVHESRVSGWQFVGGAYLPCVKGREA